MSINDIGLEEKELDALAMIGENSVQKVIKGELDLSLGEENIEKPLEVLVRNLHTEVRENKVLIEGTLKINIVYSEDDTEEYKNENFETDFSVPVEVEGARSGHEAEVVSRVEKADILEVLDKSTGENKLKYIVSIEFIVIVTEKIQMELLMEGAKSTVKAEKENLQIEEFKGINSVEKEVTAGVFLEHPAEMVEEVYNKFEEVKGKIEEEGLISVQGKMVMAIYYKEMDSLVAKKQVVEKDFSLNMEFPIAEPGMNSKILPRLWKLNWTKKGDKEIEILGEVKVYAYLTSTFELQVVTALEGIDTIKESLQARCLKDEKKVRINKEKKSLYLENVKSVNNVLGEVLELSPEVFKDKVIVKAEITSHLFYLDVDDDLLEGVESLFLEKLIKTQGIDRGHSIQMSSRIDYVRAEPLEGNYSVSLLVMGECSVMVRREKEVDVVTGIRGFLAKEEDFTEEEEKSKKEKSLLSPVYKIYVVQKNDNLEDISDRFGITVDSLVKANNISEPELVSSGEKLIIPVVK